MQSITKIIIIFLALVFALIVSLLSIPQEPVETTAFTLEEWNMLGEIYDKEIKEMGGITFENMSLPDLDKEVEAIILERVQEKDKEYKELVEYLIKKKNANSRKN